MNHTDFILSSTNEKQNIYYAKEFCHNFLNNKTRKKYIYGCNIYAEAVSKHVDISGFINDFSKTNSFLGKPIVKTNDISSDDMVLNTVNSRPCYISELLNKMNIENLSYYAFIKYSGLDIPEFIFNKGIEEIFRSQHNKYSYVYDLLGDNISRSVYATVMSFRLKGDLDLIKDWKTEEDKQYFEDFIEFEDDEVFVDIGGYNGMTSLEFAKRCPNHKMIYIFEPDTANVSIIRQNLKHLSSVNIIASGISDACKELRFCSNGPSSSISKHGEHVIKVNKLDKLFPKQMNSTYIKFDIEGGEVEALIGAEKTIKKLHPKIAIAVYHDPSHFFKIPEIILSFRNDYDIYLRHYSEYLCETVMYFIPKKI